MNRRDINQWLAGLVLVKANSAMAMNQIPQAYHIVANVHQVPADILYAIALAESGQPFRDIQQPWPWALNVDGVGIYCSTKSEALNVVNDALDQQKSIDIGLMQINWYWHKHEFTDAGEALVPIKNLNVGASILRKQFEVSQDWWDAVGRYHDPGQDLQSISSAEIYRSKVRQHWEGGVL